MLSIADWCEKTEKIVLAADNPSEMTIGYCTVDDDDQRYWKIEVHDVKSCDFLHNEFKRASDRAKLVRFFHTTEGREKLRNHVNMCEDCLPASVHEC